jgi:hypothetical protein
MLVRDKVATCLGFPSKPSSDSSFKVPRKSVMQLLAVRDTQPQNLKVKGDVLKFPDIHIKFNENLSHG